MVGIDSLVERNDHHMGFVIPIGHVDDDGFVGILFNLSNLYLKLFPDHRWETIHLAVRSDDSCALNAYIHIECISITDVLNIHVEQV